MSFTEKLSRLMRRHGHTQAGLGDLLGLSHRAVGKWLAGKSRPSVTVGRRLADIYRVDVLELMDDELSLRWDQYLELVESDRLAVEEALPENPTARMFAVDLKSEERLKHIEVERIKSVIGELASIASLMDVDDERLLRIVREFKTNSNKKP